jgi:hypothetical protein
MFCKCLNGNVSKRKEYMKRKHTLTIPVTVLIMEILTGVLVTSAVAGMEEMQATVVIDTDAGCTAALR